MINKSNLHLILTLLISYALSVNTAYASDSTKTFSKTSLKKANLNLELELKGIVLKNENNFGARICSNGFSVFYENAKFITVEKKRLWQGDFFYYIDFREKVTSTLPFRNYNEYNPTFQFGRQNELLGFRVSYLIKKELSDKTEKNGVKISLLYGGGVTLAFLKPYMLQISYGTIFYDSSKGATYYDDKEVRDVEYSEAVKTEFLSKEFINLHDDVYSYVQGSSSFIKGFGNLQFVPGLHGKFGFNFDWGPSDELVKYFEIGMTLDVYNKAMPLYVGNPNSPFFFSIYGALAIGKRH